MKQTQEPIISVMLAAVPWYKRALGATVLWSLGSAGSPIRSDTSSS